MKKLAVIPSRYGSSRFPGKPLIDLAGKSMIQRVYEGVENSGLFDTTIVATDDQRIFDHVQSFGGSVLMTSTKHQSGTERCGEVIDHYSDHEIIVNIQGDEPLVNKEQLSQLLSAFNDLSTEIATLGTIIKNKEELYDKNRIKIVLNQKGEGLYFSRSPIPFNVEDKNEYPFLRHIGLYGFRRETLQKLIEYSPTLLEKSESLEQLRWLYYGHKIQVIITSIETPNIDVPEDVQHVLNALKSIKE
ncbi:MAG: 3-deoxy-manno-octulosonate cytidylyltransferase [Brumimicrobium sp.]|nr:3-deoxy-manno-octulosonate cytidylyltransferase [Brumimicrobium sp.]